MSSPPATDVEDLSGRVQRTRVDKGKQRAALPPEAYGQNIANTSTARIDSMNVALPGQFNDPKWRYYSRNSSLSRKNRLAVLADRFGSVRAKSLVSTHVLHSGDVNQLTVVKEQVMVCTEPTDLISSVSPPSDEPFADTSAVEGQQESFEVDEPELRRTSSKTSLPSLFGRNEFSTRSQAPSPESIERHSSELLLNNHAPLSPSSTIEPFILDQASLRSNPYSPIIQSFERLSQSTFQTITTDSLSSHLPSTSSRRLTIDNEPRPILVIPTPPPSEKKPSKAKTAFLNALCCRPGAGTPPFPSRPTRLPVRTGAVRPKHFKLKPKWLRKSQTVKFDMVQKGRRDANANVRSTSSFAFNRHVSRRRRSTTSPSSPTQLNGAVSLSDMIQRAPGSVRGTPTPGSGFGSVESGLGRSPSLEERLRNMSLSDLRLREGEVAEINGLLRDVERDSVRSERSEHRSVFSRGGVADEDHDDEDVSSSMVSLSLSFTSRSTTSKK
jgi:hypothetical protein